MEKILQKRKSLGNLSTADHMGRGIAFCKAAESAACKQQGQAGVPRPGVLRCYDPVYPVYPQYSTRFAGNMAEVSELDISGCPASHRLFAGELVPLWPFLSNLLSPLCRGSRPGYSDQKVKLLPARGARLGWQSPDGLLCAGAGSESSSYRCVYWSEMLSFLIGNTSFRKCCFIWASCSWKVQSLCCGTFIACCSSVVCSLYKALSRESRDIGAWLMLHQSCGTLLVSTTAAQLCVVRGFTSDIFGHLGGRFPLCETLLPSEEVKKSIFANTSCSGRGQALLQGRSDPAHPVPWLWAGLGPGPWSQRGSAQTGRAAAPGPGGGCRFRQRWWRPRDRSVPPPHGDQSFTSGLGGRRLSGSVAPERAQDEWQTLLNKYARNVYPSENSDYRTGINLQVRTFVSSKMPELVS
ncbi:uncharacterized protein [Patagioenas fasciata]|uniref:uncharacterized protein n=1 Tax=Patagioenas fasciata TaxID=372321 RepID=UPI003A995F56